MSTPKKNSICITMLNVKTDSRALEQVGADLQYEDSDAFESFFTEEVNNSQGPILLGIEGWQFWTDGMLRKVLPNLPPPTYHQMGSQKSAATSLPTMDLGGSETSFVVNFIDMVELKQLSQTRRKVMCLDDSRAAKPVRVFYWACEAGGINSHPDRPIIVVCVETRDPGLGLEHRLEKELENHLLFNQRRWDRLEQSLHWIAVDLFFIYNRWDEVLGAITDTVANTDILVYLRSLPTMILARSIHRNIGTLIELSEYIYLHEAVSQQIKDAVGRSANQKAKEQEGNQAPRHLEKRLGEIELHLQHVKSTTEIMQKQLENLLALAFNTETIEQGRTVARLTGLAFVFVPLSFVAGLFGMTTNNWKIIWYTPAAVASLIITVLAAFFSHQAIDLWDRYHHEANHSKLSRLLRANTLDFDKEAARSSVKQSTREAMIRSVKQKLSRKSNVLLQRPEAHPPRKDQQVIEGFAEPPHFLGSHTQKPDLPSPKIANDRESGQQSATKPPNGSRRDVGELTNDLELFSVQPQREVPFEIMSYGPDSNVTFHMRRTAEIQSTIDRKLEIVQGFNHSKSNRNRETFMTRINYGMRLSDQHQAAKPSQV
ncbi:hypothetical protein PFICI_13276 [Pestalotiopsis fici W106-1]|uniref:Uncharacterized protein n=1 Tax=Pestalotiopsis fici (strain W106-1 / CGMCC3.15140) TaxID=1229662 RepID=W3WNU9_PESFW|nr:uncharacterized protein PFICI_13276 [Pestalotiopsis fici W106-1]ETS74792.1 hypothetical protein PFICI_13276 [Pestalotiopsis fici W106-1]